MIDIHEREMKSAEIVKLRCPQFVENKEVSHFAIRSVHVDEIPVEAEEFLVWGNLKENLYWRSFSSLQRACKKGRRFSPQDLEGITRIMVWQIFEGKNLAQDFPKYSDVWELLEEKDSPLAMYVKDDDRKKAVNSGFWHALKAMASKPGIWNAGPELERIVGYKEFFNLFDYKSGAKMAFGVPPRVSFEQFNHLERYLIWLLVQEIELYKEFERGKANEAIGRLAAPLVKSLLRGSFDYEERKRMRNMANIFVREDLIKTCDIQKVLGEEFELGLAEAFKRYDYSSRTLEICARNLKDIRKHSSAVWRRIQSGGVQLHRLGPEIKKYVPAEAYKLYVEQLKRKIDEMKRFDIGLFEQWISLRVGEDVSRQVHSITRNKALEVYISQGARVSGEDAEKISMFTGKRTIGYFGDRVNGFVAMDLLARRRWLKASEILVLYRRMPDKPRRLFFEAAKEYVQRFGKVMIANEGLDITTCYPHYNTVPDFVGRFPGLFQVK